MTNETGTEKLLTVTSYENEMCLLRNVKEAVEGDDSNKSYSNTSKRNNIGNTVELRKERKG